jgi:hypothetical protein
MKRINILILLIFLYQSNFIKAQISSEDDKVFPMINSDSLAKEFESSTKKWFREHELHKDNKDSAWINDFEGHWIWDSRAKTKEGKPIILIDSLSGNFYVLDSACTIITAYNKLKQIIWKSDIRKDNSIPKDIWEDSKIIYFKIRKFKKGTKDIEIWYGNSEGFIDMETGRIHIEIIN